MLERLAKAKHSSLLRKFVNYRHKMFYNIGPWTRSILIILFIYISQDV